MRTRTASRSRFGALVLLAGLLVPPALRAGVPGIGDPAPSFRALDLIDQVPVAVDTVLAVDSWTLLLIWNTACPDCMADVVLVARSIAADERDLRIVGVSTDGECVADARRFVTTTRLGFRNLWDVYGKAADAYGVGDVSFNAFLLDPARKVRLARVGHPDSADDLVRKIWDVIEKASSSP